MGVSAKVTLSKGEDMHTCVTTHYTCKLVERFFLEEVELLDSLRISPIQQKCADNKVKSK